MKPLYYWTLAALTCIAMGSAYLLDGPNEFETAQAVADDLRDAQRAGWTNAAASHRHPKP